MSSSAKNKKLGNHTPLIPYVVAATAATVVIAAVINMNTTNNIEKIQGLNLIQINRHVDNLIIFGNVDNAPVMHSLSGQDINTFANKQEINIEEYPSQWLVDYTMSPDGSHTTSVTVTFNGQKPPLSCRKLQLVSDILTTSAGADMLLTSCDSKGYTVTARENISGVPQFDSGGFNLAES
ncbi:MAG: hypothetical protein GY774_07500 [Planctomycetes bacterium]|nr:hypothetical protein [Planctomycetota bacterium]